MQLTTVTGSLLYCTVHERLYVPIIQQWLSFPAPTVSSTLHGSIVCEGTCDQCIALAKACLAWQLPWLYAPIPSILTQTLELSC